MSNYKFIDWNNRVEDAKMRLKAKHYNQQDYVNVIIKIKEEIARIFGPGTDHFEKLEELCKGNKYIHSLRKD